MIVSRAAAAVGRMDGFSIRTMSLLSITSLLAELTQSSVARLSDELRRLSRERLLRPLGTIADDSLPPSAAKARKIGYSFLLMFSAVPASFSSFWKAKESSWEISKREVSSNVIWKSNYRKKVPKSYPFVQAACRKREKGIIQSEPRILRCGFDWQVIDFRRQDNFESNW